jgi:uncharacterized protein
MGESIEQFTFIGSLVFAAGIGLSMAGHCFGMCGALASVIAITGTGRPLGRILAYNTGRVVTYFAMGTIAGGIGQSVYVSGQHRWLSITVAVVSCTIILASAGSLMGLIPARFLGSVFPSGLLGRLMVHPMPRVPSWAKSLVLGLLFGFLPCVATFGMLGFALQSGTWYRGGLIMLAFGMGTWPVMTGVPYVAQTARRFGGGGYARVAGAGLLLLGAAAMWNLWNMTTHGCCAGH